jgi:hypothetical protein
MVTPKLLVNWGDAASDTITAYDQAEITYLRKRRNIHLTITGFVSD